MRKEIVIGILLGIIIVHTISHIKTKNPRGYQLNVKTDSVYVYDGGRVVGSFKYGQNPVLDSLIINDNK